MTTDKAPFSKAAQVRGLRERLNRPAITVSDLRALVDKTVERTRAPKLQKEKAKWQEEKNSSPASTRSKPKRKPSQRRAKSKRKKAAT